MTSISDDLGDVQATRRRMLFGATASLVCAPAIVRATSLMPVRPIHRILILPGVRSIGPQQAGFVQRVYYDALARSLISGRPPTIEMNGKTVSAEQARSAVAYAKTHGFLASSVAKFIIVV